MASEEEFARLKVTLEADAKKLQRQMDEFTKDMAKGAKKVEEEFKKIRLEFETKYAKMKISEIKAEHTKLTAEFKKKVEMDVDLKSLNETRQELGAVERALSGIREKGQDAASGLSMIWDKVKGVAGSLGLLIGAREIVTMGKEAVMTAARVEGIREAFNKLNSPSLLDDLRRATRDTVTDLDLMKAAVRANNFQIPLEQLATLLEFAQRRAKQTGEQIDYLVDSIVTGIGRKSPMILDNLGISAVRLKEKFGGVSIEAANVGDVARVVGDIAREELDKIGDTALTTAEKIAQVNKVIEDGKSLLGEGIVTAAYELADAFNAVSEAGIVGAGAWRTMNLQMQTYKAIISSILATPKQAVGVAMNQAREDVKTRNAAQIKELIASTEAKIKAMEKGFYNTPATADDKNDLEQQKAKLEVYTATFNQLVAKFDPAGKSVAQITARIESIGEAMKNMVPKTKEYNAALAEMQRLQKMIATDGKSMAEIQAEVAKKFAETQTKYLEGVKFADKDYFDYRVSLMNKEAEEYERVLGKEFDRATFYATKKKELYNDYISYLQNNLKEMTGGKEVFTFNKKGELNYNAGRAIELLDEKPREMKGIPEDKMVDLRKKAEMHITDIVMEEEMRRRQAMMDGVNQVGDALQAAFSKAGDSLMSKITQAAQLGFNLYNKANTPADKGGGLGFGDILGGILSIGSIFAHSGGTFQGVSGGNVMKLAAGGSFTVPPGFPNDSYGPLWVESGERVHVTPANQVQRTDMDISALAARLDNLTSSVQAMNGNMMRLNPNITVVNTEDVKSTVVRDQRQAGELARWGRKTN